MSLQRPPRSRRFPWYDSRWLSDYLRAKEIVARERPDQLDAFVRAFDVLRTRPDFTAIHLPRVFDDATLAAIRRTVQTLQPRELELHEGHSFGRFVVHDHPDFTALEQQLTPLVGALVGEAVDASYNFLSLYGRRGVCAPHLDSPNAKWTLDVCIDQTVEWPIAFSQVVPWPEEDLAGHWAGDDWAARVIGSPSLTFTPVTLQPGEAVLFSGSGQWHYRDPIPDAGAGTRCDLLFFHFIPRGARDLVARDTWPRLFDLPALA